MNTRTNKTLTSAIPRVQQAIERFKRLGQVQNVKTAMHALDICQGRAPARKFSAGMPKTELDKKAEFDATLDVLTGKVGEAEKRGDQKTAAILRAFLQKHGRRVDAPAQKAPAAGAAPLTFSDLGAGPRMTNPLLLFGENEIRRMDASKRQQFVAMMDRGDRAKWQARLWEFRRRGRPLD